MHYDYSDLYRNQRSAIETISENINELMFDDIYIDPDSIKMKHERGRSSITIKTVTGISLLITIS